MILGFLISIVNADPPGYWCNLPTNYNSIYETLHIPYQGVCIKVCNGGLVDGPIQPNGTVISTCLIMATSGLCKNTCRLKCIQPRPDYPGRDCYECLSNSGI